MGDMDWQDVLRLLREAIEYIEDPSLPDDETADMVSDNLNDALDDIDQYQQTLD